MLLFKASSRFTCKWSILISLSGYKMEFIASYMHLIKNKMVPIVRSIYDYNKVLGEYLWCEFYHHSLSYV